MQTPDLVGWIWFHFFGTGGFRASWDPQPIGYQLLMSERPNPLLSIPVPTGFPDATGPIPLSLAPISVSCKQTRSGNVKFSVYQNRMIRWSLSKIWERHMFRVDRDLVKTRRLQVRVCSDFVAEFCVSPRSFAVWTISGRDSRIVCFGTHPSSF